MDVQDYSISYSQFLQFQINVSLVSCCLTSPKEYIHMSEKVLMNAHRFARLSVLCLFLLSCWANISFTSLSSETPISFMLSISWILESDWVFPACLFTCEQTPLFYLAGFSLQSFHPAYNLQLMLLLLFHDQNLLGKSNISLWYFPHRDELLQLLLRTHSFLFFSPSYSFDISLPRIYWLLKEKIVKI